MTTVGYGNVSPLTVLGRMVCITTAYWGTFVSTIMIIAILNFFEITEKEKKVISIVN
jgi:hypothetical protein